jgi:hypothetical protein
MKLRDKKISGEQLLLSNLEVNFLGPDLVLENCDVHSDCQSKALTISGLKMTGGRFVQQDRALTDFHFERAHFSSVKFSGKFTGCTFGDWESVDVSSIQDCDFTDAGLEDSRFLNCEIESIRLPKWPAFTIVSPAEARDFVMSRPWPSKTRIALDVYTDTDPECVAICGDAAQLAKSDDIPLDELRTLLEVVPGVKIIG